MTNLLSITTNDINTSINHEPRILDITLADALGFARAVDIRDLIIRHKEALEKFGEVVFRTVRKTSGSKGGRPSTEYWLTKKQALYICTKSQTANATDVTIQMVEVFDQVTSGKTITVKSHVRRIPAKPALPALPAPAALNLGDLAEMMTAPGDMIKIAQAIHSGEARKVLLHVNEDIENMAYAMRSAISLLQGFYQMHIKDHPYTDKKTYERFFDRDFDKQRSFRKEREGMRS